MKQSKKQAWEHLTTPERTVLQLCYGHDKTTNEVSIITNTALYKTQEILNRGKKLFIMFSEYYEAFGELMPLDLPIPSPLRLYLLFTLKQRLHRSEALNKVLRRYPLYNTRAFSPGIQKVLENISTEGYSEFHELVLEFDRWNNVRILPKHLGRITPYPRRQMKTYWPMEEAIISTSEIAYRLMVSKFKQTEPPVVWLPLVGSYLPKGIQIIPMKKTPEALAYFADNKYLVFESRELATAMGKICLDRSFLGTPTRSESFRFWPKFRDLAKEAITLGMMIDVQGLVEGREKYDDIIKLGL